MRSRIVFGLVGLGMVSLVGGACSESDPAGPDDGMTDATGGGESGDGDGDGDGDGTGGDEPGSGGSPGGDGDVPAGGFGGLGGGGEGPGGAGPGESTCEPDEAWCESGATFACGEDRSPRELEECKYGCDERGSACRNEPLACAEGTVAAVEVPQVLGWKWGSTMWSSSGGTIDSYTDIAGTATQGAEVQGTGLFQNLVAVLSSPEEFGRECVDASDFTGIKFDLSSATSLSGFRFAVATSATDGRGHCTVACLDHYGKVVPTGTSVMVPFSDLEQAGWGGVVGFDPSQIVAFLWTPPNPDDQLTVENVSFY